MNILSEFQDRGLVNRFFIKFASYFFVSMTVAALTYVYNHESGMELYVAAHLEDHHDLADSIEGKLDDIMDQINTNYLAAEVVRKIDKEESRRTNITERLAGVLRIIERGDETLPEIYFKDRDRYHRELFEIEREIAYLKGRL